MFTDIVGYTAYMHDNERSALELLNINRALQKPIIEELGGRWIKELGDGVLASFHAVTDAIAAAIRIQEGCKLSNQYQLRIGIHLGEVVIEEGDILGDGVNIASRLQTVANPGSIFVSESVYLDILNKKNFQTRFVREERFKNVAENIRIHEVLVGGESTYDEMVPHATGIKSEMSIAVLPFANMTPDHEQEFFSDGIAEEIINTLAQVPTLKVVGRTSSYSFKGKNEDLRSIGQKLGVSTLLEGSVRTGGAQIRITVQLIDVKTGYHIWSAKFDRVLNDVFEVQDEIAREIVDRLKITIVDHRFEKRLREQTRDIEAYKNYLKGKSLSDKRGRYLMESIPFFQQALDIDPSYALAYAGLADAYVIMCLYGLIDPSTIWPKAIEASQKAMKFGPELAESRTCYAAILLLHDWNWKSAEEQFMKAVQISPSYEQAVGWYGFWFLQMVEGDHERSIKTLTKCVNVHPYSFYSNSFLGIALTFGGFWQEGMKYALRGFELEPNSFITLLFMAEAHHLSGQYAKAEEQWNKALSNSNRHPWAMMGLCVTYVDQGKMEEAMSCHFELLEQSKKRYIQPAILACTAAAVGRNEEALELGIRACDEHDPFIVFTSNSFPSARAFRSVAGFDKILARIGR